MTHATITQRIARASVAVVAAGMLVGLTTPASAATPVQRVTHTAATTTTAIAPLPAEAGAACAEWQLPHQNHIYQGNGWEAVLQFGPDLHWSAAGWTEKIQYYSWDGRVMFSSATADLVEFTITWTNGSAGVYTGKIDKHGFVSGEAQDRFNPQVTTTWRMRDVANCVRR